MASGAGVGFVVVRIGMAQRALAVRPVMVERESVIEGRVLPVGGVLMALRTRRREVIGRRSVAFRAIPRADAAVVELHRLPVGRVGVAGGARRAEVVGGLTAQVAF